MSFVIKKLKTFFPTRTVFLLVFILLWLALTPAIASYKVEDKKDKHKAPEYAKGEFILKFPEQAGFVIDRNLTTTTLELPPTQTGLASINSLNTQYKVEKISSVFKSLKARQLKSGKSYKQLYGETKNRYPNRSKRAPQGLEFTNLLNIYRMELENKDADIFTICAEYEKDPNVEYCTPNYLVHASVPPTPPTDPYYNSAGSWGQPPERADYEDLWGLKKIQPEPAWDVTQGEGIVVAVVDTGLDYNHSDIAENVWINSDEIANNGIDDDGNGYVDDMRGWDFAYNDNDPWDGSGHGTHVSGTIAAVGNNGLGIIGVAPQAKIMPVKGLDDWGSGWSDDLASCLIYAVMNGADVINNSWGPGGRLPSNPVIEEAVQLAYGLGTVVVFAAGNASDNVVYYSPQNMTHPKPIVVSASNQDDAPTFFTNFGTSIDVASPGGGTNTPPPDLAPYSNILSLRAENTGDPEFIIGNNYVRKAGTSMACPHVSGLTALILANRPTFTNEEVRQVLRVSANDVADSGFDLYTGAGRINASNALLVDSVLSLTITSPASSDTFSQQYGSIAITGTAFGEGFQQYELFYGQSKWGMLPTEWLAIVEPVLIPVEEGILGNWVIQDLSDGIYTLKLVATSHSGLQFQEFVQVALERIPPRPITTHPTNQEEPEISGDKIVWQDARHGNWDIYLYDLTTKTEQRITTNPAAQVYPAISGDKIVWQDGRNGNDDIYLYDLITNTEQRITTNPANQWYPSISGDKIVWMDFRNGNYDIYLYDLTTNTEQPITTNPLQQYSPNICGDKIVWADLRNGNGDIYLYNLTSNTEQQITTNVADQVKPIISGGKITWMDKRNGKWDIYLYNLFNNTEQQIITTNPLNHWEPTISEEQIVWQDYRNGNYDIYLYNLITNTEQQITADAEYQGYPAISGGKIIWMDRRNGNWDIYLFNHPPELEPIGNKFVVAGRYLTFPVSATDPDNDLLTYSTQELPLGANFNSQTRTFSWRPTIDQIGTYNVTFSVTDEYGALDSETIQISVRRRIRIHPVNVER